MKRRLPFAARRGMTFVELLAVLVILGLVASVLTVSFAGRFAKGKREIARTQVAQLTQAVETFRIEHGAWPPVEQGLGALTAPTASPTATYFLKPEQLIDPWDNPYALIIPGPDGYPYEIVSYGADRQPGGDDEAADLSSTRLRD
jgi:general secretion pathway protein G